jgi:hypothetical protein
MFRRGFVACEQQQAGDADQLVVGELLAVLADQHAEDVVTGVPPGLLHQRGHVLAAPPDLLESLRTRNRQIQLARAAPLEVVAVVIGHTEQLADHQRRDRQREVGHQIGWRARIFQRIELRIDDLDDPRF